MTAECGEGSVSLQCCLSNNSPPSETFLKVIDSRRWLKGVIGESHHMQSNVHDRIKKAFVEVAKVQNRAKRGLGLLTSCLTNAVGAALLVDIASN